jgi:hypothetical protein
MRKSSIMLEVELAAGSDIDDACCDLLVLASQLGVTITARFNDVLLMAIAGGDSKVLADNYRKQIENKSKHKIAVSYVR